MLKKMVHGFLHSGSMYVGRLWVHLNSLGEPVNDVEKRLMILIVADLEALFRQDMPWRKELLWCSMGPWVKEEW